MNETIIFLKIHHRYFGLGFVSSSDGLASYCIPQVHFGFKKFFCSNKQSTNLFFKQQMSVFRFVPTAWKDEDFFLCKNASVHSGSSMRKQCKNIFATSHQLFYSNNQLNLSEFEFFLCEWSEWTRFQNYFSLKCTFYTFTSNRVRKNI